MTALAWAGLGLLGGAGALARYRLDELVQERAAGVFPFGTLAVNVLGSFCLGLLTGLGVAGHALLVLGTGLIGSFTTFSTWMLETHRLGEEGELRAALLNLALPLAAGLAALGAGWGLGALA